jgi:hypothetical protein
LPKPFCQLHFQPGLTSTTFAFYIGAYLAPLHSAVDLKDNTPETQWMSSADLRALRIWNIHGSKLQQLSVAERGVWFSQSGEFGSGRSPDAAKQGKLPPTWGRERCRLSADRPLRSRLKRRFFLTAGRFDAAARSTTTDPVRNQGNFRYLGKCWVNQQYARERRCAKAVAVAA